MGRRRALICGVSGQDGAYLAQLLVHKGYEVHGTTRLQQHEPPANLITLRVANGVTLHRMKPTDREAVRTVLVNTHPDEIYYLAAQSSVWRSFNDPIGTFEASVLGLITMLEAARDLVPKARLVNAASGDCFGEPERGAPASEQSPFAPRSPYAAAKCAGHHALSVARLAYSQFACSAFLFTHESPLRSEDFAVGKIVAAARRIAAGASETVDLGNVEVIRDWGWAPEYVDALWRMLQQGEPRDFVVATGRSHRLADLVEAVFAAAGLEWQEHVQIGSVSPRPTDIPCQFADPARAEQLLGWRGCSDLTKIAGRLIGPA